jgi:hypothetical protein
MFNGKSQKDDELIKYVNQIKERPILSRMPIDKIRNDNNRFLYCDPPDVILQSKYI